MDGEFERPILAARPTTRADTMEAMSNWTVTAMFGLSELHTQMICQHERAANLVTGVATAMDLSPPSIRY
jgi:hypothetical protein